MDSPPSRPRLEARQSNERPHVLIVTDDSDLAEFLAEGLPLGGFWTSVIANGLQALEVFRLRQFDIVAIDAGMQSFDAIEFLKRLRGTSTLDRSQEPRTAAPVVMIHPTPAGDKSASLEGLGVAASLNPPLELDEVVRSLHEVFIDWRQHHPDTPLADSSSARAR